MSIIYRIKFTLQISKVQPRLAPDYCSSLILHHSPPSSYSATGLLSFFPLPHHTVSYLGPLQLFTVPRILFPLVLCMLTTFTSSPDLKQTPLPPLFSNFSFNVSFTTCIPIYFLEVLFQTGRRKVLSSPFPLTR